MRVFSSGSNLERREVGAWGYTTTIYTERHRPGVKPLILLYTVFLKEKVPLSYTFD